MKLFGLYILTKFNLNKMFLRAAQKERNLHKRIVSKLLANYEELRQKYFDLLKKRRG